MHIRQRLLIFLCLCLGSTLTAQMREILPENREELVHFLLLARESRQQAQAELIKARGRLNFHAERLDYLSERLAKSRENVDARTTWLGQYLQASDEQRSTEQNLEDAVYQLHQAEAMTLLIHQQLPDLRKRVQQARDEMSDWENEVTRTTYLVTILEDALTRLTGSQTVPVSESRHEEICPICRQRSH